MAAEDNQENPEEADILKETSFKGRLQLKDFMYAGTGSDPSSLSPRRSQRLSAPQSAASSQSSSAIPTSPLKSKKRKIKSEASDTEDNTNSTNGYKSKSKKSTTKTSTPSPKKRIRKPSSYAPPSTYAHLPLLPDALAPNLLILFIGLNPGIRTAQTGHAYSHPSNLFWKLLHSSGITPIRCRAHEDQSMPARYALGHTNIVARPSRNGAELSKGEMDEGVAVLEEKCRRWRPEVACVVGKSIWESVFRVRHGRAIGKGEFNYGWQEERMGVVKEGKEVNGVKEEPWEGSRVFVATSTSGLAATLRPEEKERIWKILGDWCVQRRKERAEVKKEDDGEALVKDEPLDTK
ncbi:DNA glycosylase [Hypoxylon trugodes]|uniref:DNA glycosylase n=1 Tax=Hypoxylon trugodes TaxID=326681 RepID=UPI0021A2431E|nr:DNA glycosylase [Hypoxylon trugodes]KAI1392735.1 DNA glycosylase [Hypoxylon trugodes]